MTSVERNNFKSFKFWSRKEKIVNNRIKRNNQVHYIYFHHRVEIVFVCPHSNDMENVICHMARGLLGKVLYCTQSVPFDVANMEISLPSRGGNSFCSFYSIDGGRSDPRTSTGNTSNKVWLWWSCKIRRVVQVCLLFASFIVSFYYGSRYVVLNFHFSIVIKLLPLHFWTVFEWHHPTINESSCLYCSSAYLFLPPLIPHHLRYSINI